MPNKLSSRNQTMDVLKLFSAYMVVFIHVQFGGKFGQQVDALARYAVPFFFVVSGYFSHNADIGKLWSRIVRLIKLFLISEAIYTVYKLYKLYHEDGMGKVFGYFEKFAQSYTYKDFFIFNMPTSSTHLWFLLALIYVYIIYIIAIKFNINEKMLYIAAIILLLVQIYLGEISNAFGTTHKLQVVRNFLFVGFPFFTLGKFVKTNETLFSQPSLLSAYISIAIGVFLTLVSFNRYGSNELYIGSIFILFGFIIIAVKYSCKEYSLWVKTFTACSTYIYIFHKVVNEITYSSLKKIGINVKSVAFKNIRPVLICVLTTVLALLLNWIIKKALTFLRKKVQS